MLAAFCLEHLSTSCCKCDLLQIVDHFKLLVSKTVCKSELKALVVDKLVEAGLIQVPDLAEVSVGLSQAA